MDSNPAEKPAQDAIDMPIDETSKGQQRPYSPSEEKIQRSQNIFKGFLKIWDWWLRCLWFILTFGYQYPKRRVGQNLSVFVLRTLVTFIARFICLVTIIYYLYSYFKVSQLGFDRPLAMLHREVNKKEGTIPPRLHFSTMDNDTFSILNTTLYKETTTDLNPSVEYFEDGWNFTIVDTKVSGLIDRFEESIHFSLKIQPAFDSTYPWVTVQLAHPGSNMTYFSDKDYGNQYQFLPGHIVQIRYKPIRYNMIAPPEEENIVYNSLQRIRNFFGFGVQVEDLTYETTIEHMPPTQNFSLSPFETLLIIRPKSDIESTQFLQEAPIIQDTLSKIGGLVSLVGSILVFLFGMNLVSPWGIVASIPWFRQRIARSLAKAYGNESGHSDGPFIVGNDQIGLLDEKMQAMTQGQQILLLKERLDELEAVLRDFYLDGSIFEDYARTAKSKDQ